MSAETMKAVRLHAFGGPEALRYENAPPPAPAAGELLVRIAAVGINPFELSLRDGMSALPPEWRPKPVFPIIIGTDVSGTVVAVADDVSGFSVGDEVYSMVRFPEKGMDGAGAYAQFVTVPATQVARKPGGIDHIHAAAALMSLLTAWQFLIDVGHHEPNPLQPFPHVPVPLGGKTVLVNGAAGGVGHFAVQIAKWQGAHVIAVAAGKDEALMRELGADRFIDYRKVDAHEVVHDLDLVLDAVGGPETRRFLSTIKRGGALFPTIALGFDGQDEAERRGVTVSSVQVRSNGAQLAEIGRLLDDGTIRAVVDGSFALSAAAEAHTRAAGGGVQGKIVLTVAAD